MTQTIIAAQIHETSSDLIVVRPDRQRQLFNRKPLEELVESMREVGQIQPGVCRLNAEGQIELLVGERRLKATQILQIPFRYCLKEEITDPLLLEQIQLDENLCREALSWQEEVMAKERLHKIFQERFGVARPGFGGGHSLKDTAEHIGVAKTTLLDDITTAQFLVIPEVAAAPNKATAKKIIQRLTEQVKRHETLEMALSKKDDSHNVPLTEAARAEAKLSEKRVDASPAMSAQEQKIIYYSKRCFHGTMEDKLASFKDESVDIVCFDPPWGVEFDVNKLENPEQLNYRDSLESFGENLLKWLTLIYAKMSPQSHLYMFGAMTNIAFSYDCLERVGFETHRIPIIWYKKGAHSIRAAHKWPAMCYEPICFAHKGGKKHLVRQGQPALIETPMPTKRIKDIHPSAKHPKVYKEILLRSASPGDTILDPMAGSGMLGVAADSLAASHSLNWFLIEKERPFYDLELANLMLGYEEIARETNDVEIQIPSVEGTQTFKGLKPGTEEWKLWWTGHPEDQNSMLAWAKELREREGK
jgi:ParB/RepB/Spo0J family partition protein